jgi:hypothetical protein
LLNLIAGAAVTRAIGALGSAVYLPATGEARFVLPACRAATKMIGAGFDGPGAAAKAAADAGRKGPALRRIWQSGSRYSRTEAERE